MANYESQSRTNYFKVKSIEEFKEWVEEHDLEVVEKDGMVALLGDVYSIYDDDTDDYLDPEDAIGPHLADGEVCIIVTVGSEKMRYLAAAAVAFDSTKRSVTVNLDDIYEKAKAHFGKEPTRAEY